MPDDHDHSDRVNDWMRQSTSGLAPEQLLDLFERAMAALWNRAHLILGDVTLSAIMDRVLYNAAERFSQFESLKVEPTGIDFHKLREQGNAFDDGDLAEGIRFVIVEFLVVIGNLTGEVLTPALHSELSTITLQPSTSDKHEKGKP